MRPLFLFVFLCSFLFSYSQEKKFHLEGRVTDANRNPIADVYVVNYRDEDKSVSRANGVFDLWVFPSDSLLISHISFYKKVVSVHTILVNPIIQLEMDTINITEIDVSPNDKTDEERAMENISNFIFDPRPQPGDGFTEAERVQNILNTENSVHRSAASSVNLLKFSPSEQIGKILKKKKKRKRSKLYASTKKKNEKDK